MVYNKIEEIIGNTPLLRLTNIEKLLGLNGKLYAKLEYLNPAGSVKDRVALAMLNDAEEQGKLKAGGTIIEPTSGNTGIGLAMIGASRGYKVILTMPDTMSVERIKLLKAYGAEVVLTKGELGMKGSIEKAEELASQIKNSFIPSQFDNPANPKAHYDTTAKEIYTDLKGEIDFFVAGVGSAGTISGVGKFLKELNPSVQVIGVEPENSPLLTKGVSGSHKIQGIGANFVPKNYDGSVVDQIVRATDQNAYEYARLLAKVEGVLNGISSGASLWASVQILKQKENQNKTVVALLPDTGDRYLSTDLF